MILNAEAHFICHTFHPAMKEFIKVEFPFFLHHWNEIEMG